MSYLDRIIMAAYMHPEGTIGSSDMDALTMRKLSKVTGTNVETVRWYEKVGLLAAPVRTSGNYRSYVQGDLDRLRFIRRARDLGFTLDQVPRLPGSASPP